MFYLTRNFERQKKKKYNADIDGDVNADADTEMSIPRFQNG